MQGEWQSCNRKVSRQKNAFTHYLRTHSHTHALSNVQCIAEWRYATATTTPVKWPLFKDNLGKPVPERQNWSGLKRGKRRRGFEMQGHQLDHMQTICTSLQTDNHASTPSLNYYRSDLFPMPNQQCQSTEGNQNDSRVHTNTDKTKQN